MDDRFRYYPLPPEGIELMRKYNALHDQLHVDVERLQKEYREKIQALQASSSEQMKTLWVQMAAMAGVDASVSWNNQDWHIEGRYVDSNFAALTFYQQINPLAAILGQQPTEEGEADVDAEGAPEGTVLN